MYSYLHLGLHDTEDASSVIFQNVWKYVPSERVSHLRRPESSATQHLEPQISHDELVL